jgi:8-oxo-dGTP pyrophosphatase MutT (NUDIX family)
MTVADPAANDVPAKPASTVMLLRDVDDGVEVFMLRRTTAAAFAGGMYVFPGGKVDAVDGDEGSDEAYVIAAIRECFEEAGVLLATDQSGQMIAEGHPGTHEATGGLRRRRRSCAHCAKSTTSLPPSTPLVWFSHWITPVGESSRRFDTRFFVATPPTSQLWATTTNETIATNGFAGRRAEADKRPANWR